MKDRDLRRSFGRAGRQLVTDEFSSGRIGSEIVALYAHLLLPLLAPNSSRWRPLMTNTGDIAAWLGTFGFAIFLAAAVISFALLLILRPLLQRYALAHPNARSSHKIPTAQGAGIGVIAATIAPSPAHWFCSAISAIVPYGSSWRPPFSSLP